MTYRKLQSNNGKQLERRTYGQSLVKRHIDDDSGLGSFEDVPFKNGQAGVSIVQTVTLEEYVCDMVGYLVRRYDESKKSEPQRQFDSTKILSELRNEIDSLKRELKEIRDTSPKTTEDKKDRNKYYFLENGTNLERRVSQLEKQVGILINHMEQKIKGNNAIKTTTT